MIDTAPAASARKISWRFWLVCALAILWNGFGAFDFAATLVRGDEYCRAMGMTEAQIAYMHTYPAWMYAAWFAGTWGGLIGAVLLILRSRWALYAFVISFAGFLLSVIYHYLLSEGHKVMPAVGIDVAIFVGCLFFIWYARWATKVRILR
jgi:hypothetical protein